MAYVIMVGVGYVRLECRVVDNVKSVYFLFMLSYLNKETAK